MKTVKALATYSVICMDEDGCITDDDQPSITLDQYEGDELEMREENDNGFLFVYCKRMEIGYWVHPELVSQP